MRNQVAQSRQGMGFEVGAYFNPLPVSRDVKVVYVDKHSREDLLKLFWKDSSLNTQPVKAEMIPETTFIESGEECPSLSDEHFDWGYSSHVFEHCKDPLKTLEVWLRKLRFGGELIMFVPNKSECFDRDREITYWTELYRRRTDLNYKEKNIKSRLYEWCSLVDKLPLEQIPEKVEQMIANNSDIHFNVWDSPSLHDFFVNARNLFSAFLEYSFDIERFEQLGAEFIVKLRKV